MTLEEYLLTTFVTLFCTVFLHSLLFRNTGIICGSEVITCFFWGSLSLDLHMAASTHNLGFKSKISSFEKICDYSTKLAFIPSFSHYPPPLFSSQPLNVQDVFTYILFPVAQYVNSMRSSLFLIIGTSARSRMVPEIQQELNKYFFSKELNKYFFSKTMNKKWVLNSGHRIKVIISAVNIFFSLLYLYTSTSKILKRSSLMNI